MGSTFEAFDRTLININVPERAFRELYMPPYQAAVAAGGMYVCMYVCMCVVYVCFEYQRTGKSVPRTLYAPLPGRGRYVCVDGWM